MGFIIILAIVMCKSLQDLVRTWAYYPITPIAIITMAPIIVTNLVAIIVISQMDRSLQGLPFHLLLDFKFTLWVIIITEYL